MSDQEYEDHLASASDAVASGLRRVSRYGWVNRLMIYAIIPSLLFDIGLTVWVHSAADAATAAAKTALVAATSARTADKLEHDLCLSGNVTRHEEIAYFTYLFSLTPSKDETPAQRERVRAIVVYTDRLFAPRNCTTFK